jgi:hypothetical protein
MKTSRLLITTAAILAIAAPSAAASPAGDPATARPHVPQASTPASIIAHKEELTQQQYLASRSQSAPATPLADRTDTDNGFPVAFVLLGLTIPLGIGLGMLAARPVRTYVAAHRRPPAGVA